MEIPAAFLIEALTKSVDDTGWSPLGACGSFLRKIQPDFDIRLYGFKKLSDLVRGNPSFFETQAGDGRPRFQSQNSLCAGKRCRIVPPYSDLLPVLAAFSMRIA
jgi:hypothetical protein